MNRTVLQVPINSDLKRAAEMQAKEQGFSSLQEAVRMLLKKMATKSLVVKFEEPAIRLSAKNEKRYLKMTEDLEAGNVNVFRAKDISDLMKHLNGDSLS